MSLPVELPPEFFALEVLTRDMFGSEYADLWRIAVPAAMAVRGAEWAVPLLKTRHRVMFPFYIQWKAARTPQERARIVHLLGNRCRAEEMKEERAK